MAGNRAIPINNQTILLEVCEADKKDLEDEVKHMKDIIKSKNLEIGLLKSKLRNSETEMLELKSFLMSQLSCLTRKLTEIPTNDIDHQETNNDFHPVPEDLGHMNKRTKASAPQQPADLLSSSFNLLVASPSSKPLVSSSLQPTVFPSPKPLSSSQVPCVSPSPLSPILHSASLSPSSLLSPTPPSSSSQAPKLSVNSSSLSKPLIASYSSHQVKIIHKTAVNSGEGSSDDERIGPVVKKSKLECAKCKEIFFTATNLNNHIYQHHGNSSSEDDPFTPIPNSQKNKARKVANKCKKIKISKNEQEIPNSNNPKSNLSLVNCNNPIILKTDPSVSTTQVSCPDCGRLLLKRSLARHRKRKGCSVNSNNENRGTIIKEQGEAAPNKKIESFASRAGAPPVPDKLLRQDGHSSVEVQGTISFIVRSSCIGSNFMKKIDVPPLMTVGKVVAKVSKVLGMSREELQMRFDGRVWDFSEKVAELANQTVWLVKVEEVKEENV